MVELRLPTNSSAKSAVQNLADPENSSAFLTNEIIQACNCLATIITLQLGTDLYMAINNH